MQARNIMTSPVIRAMPDTPILEAAALLVDHRISAIPVVDGDAVVGIVSEADLLRRSEIGTQRRSGSHPWWRRIFASDKEPSNYIEAHAMKVGDIMTAPVVSIGEDMPVSEIAALFESQKIKRAPVLRAERLVGIVSRSDFVRALVSRAKPEHNMQPKSDESIRVALLAELESQSWWRPDRCSSASTPASCTTPVGTTTGTRKSPLAWRQKTFRGYAPSKTVDQSPSQLRDTRRGATR